MRLLLGELLYRGRRPAVGVAFTQYRIDRGTENDGKPRLKGLLCVVLGFFGVVRDVVSLFLKLLDRALQLRNRSADIGQLDDVGVRGLCEITQLLQIIGDLLILGKIVGKVRDDPAGERDVSRLNGLGASTLVVYQRP